MRSPAALARPTLPRLTLPLLSVPTSAPHCSVAPTVPPEEVAALLREGEGHPLRLVDIAMSVDIR